MCLSASFYVTPFKVIVLNKCNIFSFILDCDRLCYAADAARAFRIASLHCHCVHGNYIPFNKTFNYSHSLSCNLYLKSCIFLRGKCVDKNRNFRPKHLHSDKLHNESISNEWRKSGGLFFSLYYIFM